MFCGWGHERGCGCRVCEACFILSRKQAYRRALAESKAQGQDWSNDMLKKPLPGQLYGVADVPFEDNAFKEAYPTLHEYLFTERWQDGSIRTTSTLLIFVQGGCLKIVINDRDNNRSAFFNAPSVDECLTAIEASLKTETTDWKSRGGGSAKGLTPTF